MKYNTISGFPELTPTEQVIFNDILNTIKRVYEQFGFINIETPAIERKSLLLAKGGDEKEMYVLSKPYTQKRGEVETDLALHFDLTVPLARYATSHMENLNFPFRRYQIQKVWRGERSQAGRYREFYQCDADILGNNSLNLTADVEILTAVAHVFNKLNVGEFIIKINHRLILNEIIKYFGTTENNIPEVFRILDKIDKVGIDKTKEDLIKIDKQNIKIDELISFITTDFSVDKMIETLKKMSLNNTSLKSGLSELEYVIKNLKSSGISEKNFKIDLKIVRGLDYYTGIIFETILSNHTELGSVCSGGRYDNLTKLFSQKKLPGVGMSIGLTRLFLPLLKKGVWKKKKLVCSNILIIPLTKQADTISFEIASAIRNEDNKVEIYAGNKTLKKSLKYAHKQEINTVVIIGEDEIKAGTIKIKDMKTSKEVDVKVSVLKNTNYKLSTIFDE